jgi:hypothetical protein
MGTFSGKERFDYLYDFVAGMDSGQSPNYLETNELAYALNLTVREAFAHPRPAFRKLTLTGNADVLAALATGLYQGACYYKPDSGAEALIASISGRLYQFIPTTATTAAVTDITGGNAQSAVATQCWLWQAENYVIWNDGVSLPVFFDGTSTARSNGFPAPIAANNYLVAINQEIPAGYDGLKAVPDTFIFNLDRPFLGAAPDKVVIGQGSVTPLYGEVTAVAGNLVTVKLVLQLIPSVNFGLATAGSPRSGYSNPSFKISAGTSFQIQQVAPPKVAQLPAGRMGAYGQGRIVMSLPDGKQFIYGDLVGGASGTKALQYRDAVLNTTENAFIIGGGTFSIPGSIGDIRAMVFPAVLDTSLGQGPLQIHTPSHVFSCNVPVDRLTWQDTQNPLVTPPLIGAGGLGQNSTILCNGDVFFRSVDGIRSLILARRDFATWGNVPISREVTRVIKNDDQNLLPFGSAIYFDNRMLMTADPVSTTQGVYSRGLVALNFDPVSTIRGKLPSVYDGAWTGLNTLQVLTGQFNLVQRAYAFNLNTGQGAIELWEILASADTSLIADSGTTPIPWFFESATLFDYDRGKPMEKHLKRLLDGEIYISDLRGTVNFQVWYRPDEWPCWIPWHSWNECADTTTEGSQPQYRPRMGLGEPSPNDCDTSIDRPMREAYNFQIKIQIIGHCRFMGARFSTIEVPQPRFAQPKCD